MHSTFVVVYDACVLHSAVLRDFLLRLAVTEMFQAKWSDRIIAETVSRRDRQKRRQLIGALRSPCGRLEGRRGVRDIYRGDRST